MLRSGFPITKTTKTYDFWVVWAEIASLKSSKSERPTSNFSMDSAGSLDPSPTQNAIDAV